MIVGLPGTGIGGLFYLFMTFWMPFNEIVRVFQGRSSIERWKFIAFNWAVVGAILAILWLTMLAMKSILILSGFEKPKGLLEAGLAPALAAETNSFFASAGWASAISLVILVGIVHVLRVTVGRRGRVAAAPVAATRK